MQFNPKTNIRISWENCRVREWLNDDFYSSAFSEKEKDIIVLSLTNSDRMANGSILVSYSNVEDRVFLLSYNEIRRYSKSIDIKCTSTPYAQRKVTGGKPVRSWWTRDVAGGVISVSSIDGSFSGETPHNMNISYGSNGGVRPAIYIKK